MSERSPEVRGNTVPSVEGKLPVHTLIVSLLGPSGTGKSTLSHSLSALLDQRGISSVHIGKDQAIRALSRERFGNERTGYTPRRALGSESFSDTDVNARINEEILEHIGVTQVIFLEGGTRTRRAMETTLKDVDSDYIILKFKITPLEVVRRLKKRRKEEQRADDQLPIMIGKLLGQYYGTYLHKSPRAKDPDVVRINAHQSQEELAEETLKLILERLGE